MQLDAAKVVQAQRRRRQRLPRVHVDAVADALDGAGHAAGTQLHEVVTARDKRGVVQPDYPGRERVRNPDRRIGGRQHVAARYVDLAVEHERDRVASLGRRQDAVHGDDALDLGVGAGGLHDHAVAGPHPAADHGAGIAAEVEVGPVHPLHRHAERTGQRFLLHRDAFEILEQARSIIPRHVGA